MTGLILKTAIRRKIRACGGSSCPHTTSHVIIRDLMFSDHVLAPARDLIGPDLRLHTTKLNMKSANYGAAIEWHQDFAFYPHTNDDVLAIGCDH